MPTYAVHRDLPGITMDQLAGAQQAVIASSKKFSEAGTPVKLIRSNFYPVASKCTCLFESPNPEVLKKVNEDAAVPFQTIEEVLDLTP